MTTQTKSRGRIKECDVQGVTIALADQHGKLYKKPVLVIPKGAFKNHGNFPVRLGVEKALADTIKPDVLYHIVIEQGEARVPEPHWDTDYYWEVLTVEPSLGQPSPTPAQAPAPAAMATPTQDAPPWPDAEGGSERGPDRKAWVKPEAKPERDYATETRQSIEWQTSLKAAVDLHQYVTPVQPYETVIAMTIKAAMLLYLAGQPPPQQPEAKGEQHGA